MIESININGDFSTLLLYLITREAKIKVTVRFV